MLLSRFPASVPFPVPIVSVTSARSWTSSSMIRTTVLDPHLPRLQELLPTIFTSANIHSTPVPFPLKRFREPFSLAPSSPKTPSRTSSCCFCFLLLFRDSSFANHSCLHFTNVRFSAALSLRANHPSSHVLTIFASDRFRFGSPPQPILLLILHLLLYLTVIPCIVSTMIQTVPSRTFASFLLITPSCLPTVFPVFFCIYSATLKEPPALASGASYHAPWLHTTLLRGGVFSFTMSLYLHDNFSVSSLKSLLSSCFASLFIVPLRPRASPRSSPLVPCCHQLPALMCKHSHPATVVVRLFSIFMLS